MLLAIEGIDGSGKGTQTARLKQNLQLEGFRVAEFGYPRYQENFFGQRIGDFLNGRFGSLEAVHPFLAALLFSADRFESLHRLQSLIEDYDYIILDRYVASNSAHQGAKLRGVEREQLIRWIDQMEHELFGLPRSDKVVLLDLDAELARNLILRKQGRSYTDQPVDLQESNLEYQREVRACYLKLANERKWAIVPVAEEGNLRTVEAVAADVLQAALAD